MTTTLAHGTRIDFSDQGSGAPALLYLPGWCGNRAGFDAMLPTATAKRRVLAIDLPGRGASEMPEGDFGLERVVDDALAVIAASGAASVVPVASSHAGWVAIELRRRLGERIPALVLLDWIVTGAPPPFVAALAALQGPGWEQARDRLFDMWLRGSEVPAVVDYVRKDIGSATRATWARAGREIAAGYERWKSPLAALAALTPPVPTLHLYAQPDDAGYLDAQRAFAHEHPWFRATKLEARTHFPMLETPETVANAIESFVEATRR